MPDCFNKNMDDSHLSDTPSFSSTLQLSLHQTSEREASLLEEKALLKTAVTAAISQKEALEGAVSSLQRDHTALLNESVNLRNQVGVPLSPRDCNKIMTHAVDRGDQWGAGSPFMNVRGGSGLPLVLW